MYYRVFTSYCIRYYNIWDATRVGCRVGSCEMAVRPPGTLLQQRVCMDIWFALQLGPSIASHPEHPPFTVGPRYSDKRFFCYFLRNNTTTTSILLLLLLLLTTAIPTYYYKLLPILHI